MLEKLTIGKLAKQANVNVETIRFYERQGILKQPRKQKAFRYYPKDYTDKIIFIQRAQDLGFNLKEVRELLDLRIKNHAKCSDVLVRTEIKIKEIEAKIRDLKRMKKSLQELRLCCEDSSIALSACPVLEYFTKG